MDTLVNLPMSYTVVETATMRTIDTPDVEPLTGSRIASCGGRFSELRLQRPLASARGLCSLYPLFRVRKTPAAAIRTKGASRTKPHSKAWMATPMTAVSGAL